MLRNKLQLHHYKCKWQLYYKYLYNIQIYLNKLLTVQVSKEMTLKYILVFHCQYIWQCTLF